MKPIHKTHTFHILDSSDNVIELTCRNKNIAKNIVLGKTRDHCRKKEKKKNGQRGLSENCKLQNQCM